MSSTANTTESTTGNAHGENPLKALIKFGQSVWLDYIRRDLISTGELQKLITNDGLRGMTSNPSIFEKAIAGNPDYQKDLNELEGQEPRRESDLRTHRDQRYSVRRGRDARRVRPD